MKRNIYEGSMCPRKATTLNERVVMFSRLFKGMKNFKKSIMFSYKNYKSQEGIGFFFIKF